MQSGKNNSHRKCPAPKATSKVLETNALCYVVLGAAACLCYGNALGCGFVFDDMSAIRDNQDLRPTTPFANLLWNDFWGTPIRKEQSHKSYRPLCVITYRLNYYFHKLQPFGYHLTNVILHGLVCIAYMRMCVLFVPRTTAFVAALLFTLHPVHTEAVTGVVGRAELLSSFFFVLAFLSYAEASSRNKETDWTWLTLCIIFIGMATFSKEQGITVIGVCCAYEVFSVQKLRLPEILQLTQSLVSSKGHPSSSIREALIRMSVLGIWALCLLLLRLSVMGAQLPVFTKFDNPAAAADSPARQLTLNYLLALNGWLLCFPCDLCCDWTMGTIPLVGGLPDPRNAATVAFYCTVGSLLWTSLWVDDSRSRLILFCVALLCFPFLPASNLFFPVGFVVAERVLYTPSMGFCLLVSYGWSLLHDRTKNKSLLWCLLIAFAIIHATKTVRRNYDWKSEYTIFMAGLKVNQRNAKLYNNVGHSLESQGRHHDALEYFRKAVRVQPDDIGAHINVGRTYNHLQLFNDAEQAFRKAKDLLPRPKAGEPYQARIAPSHLNVFLNLANLISRNGTRLEEADKLYKQAISMRSDYIQAYINRGDILIRLNRTHEAQSVYEKALRFDDSNPDIYYNLGVVFLEQRRTDRALIYFDKALELNPEHEQALLNSAILIQESGIPNLRKVAYDRLNVLLRSKRVNERVYFNLGMLAMDEKNFTLAEKWFRKAVKLRADFRSALFNLALLLSDAARPMEAVPFLRTLLKYHPDHVKGLILLGDIYINTIRDLDAAQECYENILGQEPSNIQALHNLCVVHVERGLLAEAEACLEKAAAMAPHEQYVHDHLKIVRARRRLIRQRSIASADTHSAKAQKDGATKSSDTAYSSLTAKKDAETKCNGSASPSISTPADGSASPSFPRQKDGVTKWNGSASSLSTQEDGVTQWKGTASTSLPTQKQGVTKWDGSASSLSTQEDGVTQWQGTASTAASKTQQDTASRWNFSSVPPSKDKKDTAVNEAGVLGEGTGEEPQDELSGHRRYPQQSEGELEGDGVSKQMR